jgi:hypothetical protein
LWVVALALALASVSPLVARAAEPPGAPSNVVAAREDSGAMVSWTPPGSDGGSAITSYMVRVYWASSDELLKEVSPASDTTSVLVAGLTNGESYSVDVMAANEFGYGPASARSSVVVPGAVPGPVSEPIAWKADGSGAANVRWGRAASDGGFEVTGYRIRAYEGSTAEVVQTVTVDGARESQVVVRGLTDGHRYSFDVAAINDVGTGEVAERTDEVLIGVPGFPGPAALWRVTPGNASAWLEWGRPTDIGGGPVTGYQVAIRRVDNLDVVERTVTVDGPDTTSTVIRDLENGTTYRFDVSAVNEFGAGFASRGETTAGIPLPPRNATVSAVGDGHATVDWDPPLHVNGGTITQYIVKAQGEDKQVSVDGSSSRATVFGLTNGGLYSFTVTAVNEFGRSLPSNMTDQSYVGLPPGAPTIDKVEPRNGAVWVDWTAPANPGKPAFNGYKVSVYRGDTLAGGVFGGFGGQTEETISGLTNGTAYTVVVSVDNQVGETPSVRSSSVTPRTTPGAPTIGTPSSGNASATVRWTAPTSNGGATILGYRVRAWNGTTLVKTTTTSGTARSLVVTGLTNGRSYRFDVAANNAAGIGPISAKSATVIPAPTPPSAPKIGTATSGSIGSPVTARATWSAPTTNGGSAVTGYRVRALRISSTGAVVSTIVSSVRPATSRSLTMTLPSGKYRFTVQAINKIGNSPQSARSNLVTAR